MEEYLRVDYLKSKKFYYKKQVFNKWDCPILKGYRKMRSFFFSEHNKNTIHLNSINAIIQNREFSEEEQGKAIFHVLENNPNIDFNQHDYKDILPLHLSCLHKKLNLVKLFLNYGAYINKTSFFPAGYDADLGLTPEMPALCFAFINSLENREKTVILVKYLLAKGSQVNFGLFSPLFITLVHPQLNNLTLLLIKHGANINETDEWGNSFLMVLINDCSNYSIYGNEFPHMIDAFKTIPKIILYSININQINREGETALSLACKRNVPIVGYLLENGAVFPKLTNDLLHCTITNGDLAGTQHLIKRGASATTGLYLLLNKVCLSSLAIEKPAQFFDLFVKYGANINQLDYLEKSYSYFKGSQIIRLELIKSIIELRVKYDSSSYRGNSDFNPSPFIEPRYAKRFMEHNKEHYAEVIKLLHNYKPFQIMSLKTICIRTFFENPNLVSKNSNRLPEELLVLMKEAGEQPDTSDFRTPGTVSNYGMQCTIL